MLLHVLMLRKRTSFKVTAERTLMYVDQSQRQFWLVLSEFSKGMVQGTFVLCM
jgi:hypothetical protein